jgi:hypothetical protein
MTTPCPHLLRDAAVHFVAMNAGYQMGIASAVYSQVRFILRQLKKFLQL